MAQPQEGRLVAELQLTQFLLEVRTGQHGNYFKFINQKHPEKNLRLFRSAMLKLVKELPNAIVSAREMEMAGVEDGTSHEVATINSFNKTDIILYIQMYEGSSYIFLRMYREQDDGSKQPCKYGVQFSPMDSIETLTNFVNKNK